MRPYPACHSERSEESRSGTQEPRTEPDSSAKKRPRNDRSDNGLRTPDYRQLTVSVIIPTKNRPKDLIRTLETLFRQTVLPQQLVVIDQSESQEGMHRFDALWAGSPPEVCNIKVHYIRDTLIASSSKARNRGMKLAKGDVWLFLDDDVEMEPEFIEKLLNAYQSHPEAAGVSGIITNEARPPLRFRLWNLIFVHGPFRDQRQPIYWNAESLRNSGPIPVRHFTGALMSFRAQMIQDLEFDESLSGYSMGEDVDFCERVRQRNTGILPVKEHGQDAHATPRVEQGTGVLVIAPRARLKHLKSPAGRDKDRVAQSARGAHFLYRKHWDHGLVNRLCFAWLNAGYWLLAVAACARNRSLKPLRSLASAVRNACPEAIRQSQGCMAR